MIQYLVVSWIVPFQVQTHEKCCLGRVSCLAHAGWRFTVLTHNLFFEIIIIVVVVVVKMSSVTGESVHLILMIGCCVKE